MASGPNVRLNDEQRKMLESLLVDRFQLKFHHDVKDGPVYILVKTGKPSKLQPPKDERAEAFVRGPQRLGGAGGRILPMIGRNVSMSHFVEALTAFTGRPVLDQTGISGTFDFAVDMVDDDPQWDRIAAIFTSVEALGLKLESSKGPVTTIVIDSAAKPSAN